jgi:anti-sigma factor RsiW
MSYLTEEERANLVAYLDGELDEESTQALEARMSTDPKFRDEAEALERTWELLDFLPRPEPSNSFTHKTLERLAISDQLKQASRSSQVMALPGRRRVPQWILGVGWAAAIVMAVGGGLLAAQLFWPPAPPRETPEIDEHLVRSLRVIENKHLYDPVDDLDFLRALEHPDLFGDDTAGG